MDDKQIYFNSILSDVSDFSQLYSPEFLLDYIFKTKVCPLIQCQRNLRVVCNAPFEYFHCHPTYLDWIGLDYIVHFSSVSTVHQENK